MHRSNKERKRPRLQIIVMIVLTAIMTFPIACGLTKQQEPDPVDLEIDIPDPSEWLLGAWTQFESPNPKRFYVWTFKPDSTFTIELTGTADLSTSESYSGTWTTNVNNVVIPEWESSNNTGNRSRTFTHTLALHPLGNTRMFSPVDRYGLDSAMLFYRLDGTAVMPFEPPENAVALPLFDPAQVVKISFEDNWKGLNVNGPKEELFFFDRLYGDWTGVHRIAWGYRTRKVELSTGISLTTSVADEIFETLANVSIAPGSLEGQFLMFDSYPSRKITIELDGGEEIVFKSSSQGLAAIPWNVSFNDKMYFTISSAVFPTFEMVEPYLSETLEEEVLEIQAQRD